MAGKPAYSAEELELLTDEEREGLLDEDLVDDDPDEAADAGEEAAGSEPDPTDAAAQAAAAKAKADAEAAAAAAAEADKAKAADATKPAADPAKPASAAEPTIGDAAPTAAPFPQFDAPADAAKRIDTLEQQKDDLAKQFDEGELTASELRAKMKPLEAEERALRDGLLKASLTIEAAKTMWGQVEVPKFLRANPMYEQGSVLFDALDTEVRKLQTEALAAGGNQYDPTLIAKAHERITSGLIKAGVQLPGVKKAADPGGKKRELPPSLSNVPAADPTDVDENEFSALDRLADSDPLAFEEALAKMSDAERERYLAV